MKKEKCFLSFSYYDHYAVIKREKSFFHLVTIFTNEEGNLFFFYLFTTITTPSSREKKSFFQLATTITTTWSREKKFFFRLATKITTSWSREKEVFFIQPLCPLMKKEKCCFSFIHYNHYAMTKSESFFLIELLRSLRYDVERKNFFFIYLLRPPRHDQERKFFFSFNHFDH